MENIRTYSRIVAEIYDCVGEPALWTSVLNKLTRRYNGLLTTMSILDTSCNEARFACYDGPEDVVHPLITKYARYMPLYHVIPRMEIDTPINIETFFQMAGPGSREEVFVRSSLGTEWVVPNDVRDAICLALVKQQSRVGTLVISTTGKRPPVSADELNDLALLAPHLRRAATIGDLFEMAASERVCYRDVFDKLSTAIVVVSANLRILLANASAESLLREGVLMSSRNGHLTFHEEMIGASIARTVKLGEANEFALGARGIGVPLATASLPAIAHVLPMRRRNSLGRLDDNAAAAIFVALPGSDTVPAVEALAGIFGLTPAEKRVARLVADGKNRGDIAVAHGVAESTVKSQLDAIFDKTDVRNQRQLQDLIRLLNPPVKPKA